MECNATFNECGLFSICNRLCVWSDIQGNIYFVITNCSNIINFNTESVVICIWHKHRHTIKGIRCISIRYCTIAADYSVICIFSPNENIVSSISKNCIQIFIAEGNVYCS